MESFEIPALLESIGDGMIDNENLKTAVEWIKKNPGFEIIVSGKPIKKSIKNTETIKAEIESLVQDVRSSIDSIGYDLDEIDRKTDKL